MLWSERISKSSYQGKRKHLRGKTKNDKKLFPENVWHQQLNLCPVIRLFGARERDLELADPRGFNLFSHAFCLG